jgi:hypothetical protein
MKTLSEAEAGALAEERMARIYWRLANPSCPAVPHTRLTHADTTSANAEERRRLWAEEQLAAREREERAADRREARLARTFNPTRVPPDILQVAMQPIDSYAAMIPLHLRVRLVALRRDRDRRPRSASFA